MTLEVLEQMLIEMVARPEFLRDHLDIAMGVDAARCEGNREWVVGVLAEVRETYLAKDSGLDAVKSQAMERIRRRREEAVAS